MKDTWTLKPSIYNIRLPTLSSTGSQGFLPVGFAWVLLVDLHGSPAHLGILRLSESTEFQVSVRFPKKMGVPFLRGPPQMAVFLL